MNRLEVLSRRIDNFFPNPYFNTLIKNYRNDSIVPDYNSLGLTRCFTVFKPLGFTTTQNYPLTIKDEINNRNLNVFFDNKGELSKFSKVSTTSTETSETLQDVINLGNSSLEVIEMHCIISAWTLTKKYSPGNKVYLVYNGQIIKNYGKTALLSSNYQSGFISSAIPEISNNSYDFSLFASATPLHNEITVLVSTLATSYNGLRLSYQYKNSRNEDYIYYNGGFNKIGLLQPKARRINHTDTIIADKTTSNFKAYTQNVLQGSTTINGSPNGNNFLLISFYNNSRCFGGFFRNVSISDNVATSSMVANYYNQTNNYIDQF